MAHKITYAVDAAFNFQIGGFATGAYNCKCTVCKERFIGDKRSNQCLGCAIDALANTTICPKKRGKIKPCYNKGCPNYGAADREGFNCFVYHPDRVEICPKYGA